MADEVHAFTVTIPAGTPIASPRLFNLAMPSRRVDEVRVKVPPGPRGEVGWVMAAAGQQMIPEEAGAFIVTDNETVVWPLQNQIDSGAWQLIAYNTGGFNHSLYIQFLTRVTSPNGDPAAGFAPIPADILAG